MTRRLAIIGVVGALLVVGAIWASGFLSRTGDCLSSSEGASCPTLAEVNGVRYGVSVARGVVASESDVTPFMPIARTNVPSYFTEQTAYLLTGISPTAVLVAPAAAVLDEDDSRFRVLWGPDSQSAFPQVCHYFNEREQTLLDGCGPPRASAE